MIRILIMIRIVILIGRALIILSSILSTIFKKVIVLGRDVAVQTLLAELVVDATPSRIGQHLPMIHSKEWPHHRLH